MTVRTNIPNLSSPRKRRAVRGNLSWTASKNFSLDHCVHVSWSCPDNATSPEGRSKNASVSDAFFGWGERCNESSIDGSARFLPPEKSAPLRFHEFFDLPSGEVSRNFPQTVLRFRGNDKPFTED
jgi:hypothetical protein